LTLEGKISNFLLFTDRAVGPRKIKTVLKIPELGRYKARMAPNHRFTLILVAFGKTKQMT
jgi:hypothetical protein